MQIYNIDRFSNETFSFTDEFIRLVQLRLALEIAKEKGEELEVKKIGKRKYWSVAKFEKSTEKALGEKISSSTTRRCFGKVECDQEPSRDILVRFCKYLGIMIGDAKRLSPTQLEREIIERYGYTYTPDKNPGGSTIEYTDSNSGLIVNDKNETIYLVSSSLKMRDIVEIYQDNRGQDKYCFRKTEKDKNRFKVMSAPQFSKLHVGDTIIIESFAVGVKINGYGHHSFSDDDRNNTGVYISQGNITKIEVFRSLF